MIGHPVLALVLGAALAVVACSSEADNCPSGQTKACLPDGTTCTCSPSCSVGSDDCHAYSLCAGSKCATCSSSTCSCTTGICVPSSWHSGESVSFRRE